MITKVTSLLRNRSSSFPVQFFRKLVTEEKICVDGINLNYVKSGNGSKSVLIMPGALGSCFTDFRPQIENLPIELPDFQLIFWDPPGYGKSRPPARYFTVDFFRTDALLANKLMKKLEIYKYSVLGWSDGGITAMILAAEFPLSIVKLVIWGSNAYITKDELNMLESIRDVSKWSPKMREPLEELYGAKYFGESWSDWVDIFIKIYNNGGDICKKDLNNIIAPTLILHGEKDSMIAPEHIPYLMKHISCSKLHIFPDGKHNIHLRYADEFNKIVSCFLKD